LSDFGLRPPEFEEDCVVHVMVVVMMSAALYESSASFLLGYHSLIPLTN
jgi:hypothetical protein